MTNWIISGVARSGTTLLYQILFDSLQAEGTPFAGIYEPYLWGKGVWNLSPADFRSEFNVTDNLHPYGIYTHTETPLHLLESHETHDAFLNTILDSETNALVKVIRGAGRLQPMLDYGPDTRIIHLVRNPLDVCNSLLSNFSPYGDEYHPSDRARFLAEINAERTDDFGRAPQTEMQWNLLWWKHMNDWAFEAAVKNPDRVLILPYELWGHDPYLFLKLIGDFAQIRTSGLYKEAYTRQIKGKTNRKLLKSDDVSDAEPYFRWFVEWASGLTQAKSDVWTKHLERAGQKYASGSVAGHYYPALKRNMSSLRLRKSHAHNAKYTELLLCSQRITKRETLARLSRVADGASQLQSSRKLWYLNFAFRDVIKTIDNVASEARVVHEPLDVTCIITSFNNGAYLRGAIDSVLNQSRPVKSILIADDCSQDGSQEFIRRYAEENPQIDFLCREQNIGVGRNRDDAFRRAESEFVTQLDGDDFIYPKKIEHELRAMEVAVGDPTTLVAFSDMMKIDEMGLQPNSLSGFAELQSREKRLEALLLRRNPLPHNMTFSKRLYQECGGYDTEACLYEDWGLKLRLAKHASNWVYSGVVGLVYNRHGQGLSAADPLVHWYWRLYCLSVNCGWLIGSVGPEMLVRTIAKINEQIVGRHVSQADNCSFLSQANTEYGARLLIEKLSTLSKPRALNKKGEGALSESVRRFFAKESLYAY
ncbi:glycosyltransferase [Parvularcula marina]|uniref:glycosyltransferase n=1 Tax=Parvularcula marina TaxID=2292771 RepID=UPI0035160B23